MSQVNVEWVIFKIYRHPRNELKQNAIATSHQKYVFLHFGHYFLTAVGQFVNEHSTI